VTALLIFTGLIRPWHVYVTAVLMAIVQTFLQPARAALISDAVPPNNLTNAIGLNAVVFNAARSTGPALAGVLIAKFGTGGAYSVQALFFFLATIWTTQLRSAQRAAGGSRGHSARGILQRDIEGWKFNGGAKLCALRFSSMFVSLFISPFTTLLPVFARVYKLARRAGAKLWRWAWAHCAALFSLLRRRWPRGMLMLVSVMLYGFFTVMFAASPWFSLSMVLMVIVGLCHVHSHALVQTVIQSYSPSEFRGRTMAIFHMSQVVLTIGAMLFGALSSIVGAQWAVASMGAVGALIMIGISLALPGARLIR
jgi:predicted MFS family arabinose efflux permease